MTSKTIVERHFEATEKLSGIRYDLAKISNALFTVGNSELAWTLRGLAATLEETRTEFTEVFTDQIQSEFRQSQQSSANMLNACIAGIIRSPKEKSECPNSQESL